MTKEGRRITPAERSSTQRSVERRQEAFALRKRVIDGEEFYVWISRRLLADWEKESSKN